MSISFHPKAFFFFENEDKELMRISLADGIIFGRRDDCEVVIDDDRISGQHFQVHITDGLAYIEDLDSVNKTYINGQFIDPLRKRLLKEGDIISVGEEIYGFSHKEKLTFDLPKKVKKKTMTITNIENLQSLDLDTSGRHLVDARKDSKRLLNMLTESKKIIKQLEEEKISIQSSIHQKSEVEAELLSCRSKMAEYEEELKDEDIAVEEVQKRIENHKNDIEEFHKNIQIAEAQIAKLKKNILEYQESIEDREVRLQNLYDEMGVFTQYADVLKKVDTLESRLLTLNSCDQRIAEIELAIKQEKARYKQTQKEYGEAVAMARSTGSTGRGRKAG
ncbi:MAG: FHA domain-containing protein [Deltaproteobacteria bacterium]|nr:MAG: FHA domain-containing protein [Deltaproteobacteria bacterium]